MRYSSYTTIDALIQCIFNEIHSTKSFGKNELNDINEHFIFQLFKILKIENDFLWSFISFKPNHGSHIVSNINANKDHSKYNNRVANISRETNSSIELGKETSIVEFLLDINKNPKQKSLKFCTKELFSNLPGSNKEFDKNLKIKIKQLWLDQIHDDNSIAHDFSERYLGLFTAYYELFCFSETKLEQKYSTIYYNFLIPVNFSKNLSKSAFIFSSMNEIEDIKFSNILYVLQFIFSKDVLNRLKESQIKSAIASIMSRNMSHNLGSHILSGTKAEIAKYNYILNRGQVLGTYRLFQYIQERMDFLSVIINHEPSHKEFNAPLNLKADILDEFAIDGRGKRHNSSNDLCSSFLLTHIVSSEKITRDIDNKDYLNIEIQLLKKERINNSIIFKCFTSLANGDNNSNEFNEINFSVPLGVNSRHAFLTILENYIRNIAKHKTNEISNLININKSSNTCDKLIISILVEECSQKVPSIGNDMENDQSRNYRILIFDNLPVREEDVKNLNKRINVGENDENEFDIEGIKSIRILNDNHSLNKYNKGLKEMLICVAWLKGKTNDWSLIEKRGHNLMKYVNVSTEVYGQSGIADINKTYSGISFELQEHNFYYYKKITFDESILDSTANIPSAEIYIIDFDDNDGKKYLMEEIQAILPKVLFFSRLTELSKEELSDIKDNKNNKKLLEKLYVILYKNKFRDYKIIVNYDSKIEEGKEDPELISRTGKFYPGNYMKILKEAKIPVFFTSHNDSPEIFIKTINELIKNKILDKIRFIEGISGGNFTYNLLCNAPIDKIQYYRILEAATTKIAIIDERIYKRYKDISFDNVTEVKSSFTEKEVNILNDLLKSYKENAIGYNEIVKSNDRLFDTFLMVKGVQNNNSSKKSWLAANNKIEIATKEGYNKLWLRKKNIFIYNAHKFEPYKLADIEDNTIDKIEEVDFLSIHYGILEKLKFHENKKQLKEYLEEIGVDVSHTKVCIHSGRGGVVQLQDDVTFIPVSSIDAQLDDSKYKLTQMFLNLNFKPF